MRRLLRELRGWDTMLQILGYEVLRWTVCWTTGHRWMRISMGPRGAVAHTCTRCLDFRAPARLP